MKSDVYTYAELGAILGVPTSTFSQWKRHGHLPSNAFALNGTMHRCVIDPLLAAGTLQARVARNAVRNARIRQYRKKRRAAGMACRKAVKFDTVLPETKAVEKPPRSCGDVIDAYWRVGDRAARAITKLPPEVLTLFVENVNDAIRFGYNR